MFQEADKRKKRILVLLICLLCSIVFTGCGVGSSPEKVTEKFFSGVKSGDIDKSIECMAPSVQEGWKAGMSLSNTLFSAFGVSIDSSALLNGLMGMTNAEHYKNYDFKVVDTSRFDETHAVVTVDVLDNGKKITSTTVPCVLIDGKWYIER